MQLRESGWEGGGPSDVVVGAGEAKNGTPISAVSYVVKDTAAVSIQRSLRLDAKTIIVACILHLR